MKSLFSPLWYRVSALRPRLRPHAELHRQQFRGQVWYVLQDHQTGRFHRISSAANLMINLMNGQRTVQQLWDIAGARAGDDPPTQDETIQLLAQLHSADLLQAEIPPDIVELADRSSKGSRRELLQRLRNPLAVRFPIFDPDRILDLTLPFVRPLFTTVGFLVWLGLVLTAAVIVTLHWQELSTNLADRVLAAENVLIILCIYPFLKAFHEMGHAYATKVWGGEVHEVGVMLLILIPIPYVDASAASAFSSKRQRIVVGAAGILVELLFASIAAIIWINASPGLLRTVAFNVMLIGGVSTLIFNGNPLLRFDGYYMLSDFLEIPNLGNRSNKYVFYLIQRYFYHIDSAESPVTGPGEAKWLFGYAIASFAYRILVSLGIAMLLATRLFIFGTAMALWTVISLAILPLAKGIRFVVNDSRLDGRRQRGYVVTGTFAAIVALLLFVVPVPYATIAQGVVWIPQNAEVRAQTDGFVEKLVASPNQTVIPNRPLIELENPLLGSRVNVREAQLQEMQERYEAAKLVDRVQAEIISEQINHIESTLRLYRTIEASLVVASEQSGRLVIPKSTDLPGRYVKKGELLGYVIDDRDVVVRVVITQDDVDLVRQRTKNVTIRFVEDIQHEFPARIRREVPGGAQELPTLALSTQGGGTIALNPGKTQKPEALYNIFQFDVEPTQPRSVTFAGSRVYVRFDHGGEPIAWRVLRSLKQTFLSHFHV